MKSLEADERESNQKSASASRSPPSTPGLDGSSDWPMSFQDTKDLLSQIDQTRSRLNDYLSELSHGTRVQPTSQQCFWNSSNLPDFDVSELNALSQSLDKLDPEFDLETFNVALDESCFDYAMTQNGPVNTYTFSEPLITPPLTLTPGSCLSTPRSAPDPILIRSQQNPVSMTFLTNHTHPVHDLRLSPLVLIIMAILPCTLQRKKATKQSFACWLRAVSPSMRQTAQG